MPDLDLLSPASTVPGDVTLRLRDRVAVCLSGGGYGALRCHSGGRWRRFELGRRSPGDCTAPLPDRTQHDSRTFQDIPSESRDSMTSGMLGHQWKSLAFSSTVSRLDTSRPAPSGLPYPSRAI